MTAVLMQETATAGNAHHVNAETLAIAAFDINKHVWSGPESFPQQFYVLIYIMICDHSQNG